MHSGIVKRAWIVGNGPSLNDTPLELLNEHDEVVFACNRIHLLYDMGRLFRPTHYVKIEQADPDWGSQVLIHLDLGCKCYVTPAIGTAILWELQEARQEWRCPNNLIFVMKSSKHSGTHGLHPRKPDSWHLPELCCFGGAVGIAMQIAVLEGYNQLCLVGCDLGYIPQVKYSPEPDPNHFHPDYKEWDHIAPELRNETLLHMHKVANKSCGELGIKVINAGVEGELDIYPRYSISEILQWPSH